MIPFLKMPLDFYKLPVMSLSYKYNYLIIYKLEILIIEFKVENAFQIVLFIYTK